MRVSHKRIAIQSDLRDGTHHPNRLCIAYSRKASCIFEGQPLGVDQTAVVPAHIVPIQREPPASLLIDKLELNRKRMSVQLSECASLCCLIGA